MESRQKQLLDLKSYLHTVDTEVTMILQSLQWDRKRLLEGSSKVTCQYDANHKVPLENLAVHEKNCLLTNLGYSRQDVMLPDPPDATAGSLIKLSKTDIQHVINAAAAADPTFKRVIFRFLALILGSDSMEPLTLERLQVAYSADERRAIHDAVVQAAPSCHDLGDLASSCSTAEKDQDGVGPSRVEILAELRNMKRRRTKYRVAAKTRNYSDVLRDVIKTQMEMYSEVKTETTTFPPSKSFNDSTYDKKYQSTAHIKVEKDNSEVSYRNDNHKNYSRGSSSDKYEIKNNSRERHNKTGCLGDRYEDRRSGSDSRMKRNNEDDYRHSKYYKEHKHKRENTEYQDKRDERRRKKESLNINDLRKHNRKQRSSSRDRTRPDKGDKDKYSHRGKSYTDKVHKDKGYKRYYDTSKKERYAHEEKRWKCK